MSAISPGEVDSALEKGQQNEESLNLKKGKQAKPLKKAVGTIPLAESQQSKLV